MKRLLISLAALSLFACSAPPPPAAEKPAAPAELPVTSKSTEAVDHFKKGRDLSDNQRAAEAAQEFDQALKLDPDFALALAYKGGVTPGPDGLAMLEQANAKAGSLSKPEQLVIGAMLAGRRSEFAKAEDQWRQAAGAVPTDWRIQLALGSQLFVAQKYGEAIDALSKATSINANAGPAYNMLGYAHLFQGEAGPAVEALQKYASLAPTEPNPQDSLGEALLAEGKFADAEAAFRRAIALSPKFAIAWDGVAYSKFFAGDWAGGKEAIAHEREAAQRPSDRAAADELAAFASLAEGKTADGLKQFDAIEKSSDSSAVQVAFVPVNRAVALLGSGRYREAVAEAAKSLAIADAGKLPPAGSANLRTTALSVTAAAQGRMGDPAGVAKTVEALQHDASAAPDNPFLKSALQFAQGMAAVAQKDLKAARAHFDMCSSLDTGCLWQAFEVSRTAKDNDGATAALARLNKIYRRDPFYLFARMTTSRTPKPSN